MREGVRRLVIRQAATTTWHNLVERHAGGREHRRGEHEGGVGDGDLPAHVLLDPHEEHVGVDGPEVEEQTQTNSNFN
jgi:hypothetical protein